MPRLFVGPALGLGTNSKQKRRKKTTISVNVSYVRITSVYF